MRSRIVFIGALLVPILSSCGQGKGSPSAVSDLTAGSSDKTPSLTFGHCIPIEVPLMATLGHRFVAEETARAYVDSLNPDALWRFREASSGKDIVSVYYEEAKNEGVSADAALAQALHETGLFRFPGILRPEQNNFGGLGGVDNAPEGAYFESDASVDSWSHPSVTTLSIAWGGRWPALRARILARNLSGMRKGVRAHIQHLKAYATTGEIRNFGVQSLDADLPANFIWKPGSPLQKTVDPSGGIVSPRFGFVARGIAPQLANLENRWSTDPEYVSHIFKHLVRMSTKSNGIPAYGCTGRLDACGLAQASGCGGVLVCEDGVDRCVATGSAPRWCVNRFEAGEWSCIATGASPESPAGNFFIDTLAGIPAGGLIRALGAKGVKTVVTSKAVTTNIATLSNITEGLDDAVLRAGDSVDDFFEKGSVLNKIIDETNPLSATDQVGGGNCANAALSMAYRLLYNQHVCAIPSPFPSDGKILKQWLDARDIFPDATPFPATKKGLITFTYDGLTTNLDALANGEIIVLISSAEKLGGNHASLALKLGDTLVHINNQNWTSKVSTLKFWNSQWGKFVKDEGIDPDGVWYTYYKLGKLKD